MWRRLTSFTWDNEYFSKLLQSLDEGQFLKMVVVMQMRTHFVLPGVTTSLKEDRRWFC